MIGHLLDHTARVWRLTESIGATFRETVPTHEVAYESLPCTFTRRNTVISGDGPGWRPVGDRTVYFDVGPLFHDRDVIELLTGPAGFQSGQLLEVESIATPRGHHIELRVVEFKGQLPEPAS